MLVTLKHPIYLSGKEGMAIPVSAFEGDLVGGATATLGDDFLVWNVSLIYACDDDTASGLRVAHSRVPGRPVRVRVALDNIAGYQAIGGPDE